MTRSPRPVRVIAFEILSRVEKERSHADILLDHLLCRGEVSDRDRGLLTELVYGTLRRQGTLDWLIDSAQDRADRLERSLRTILRLGIYQLLFLDRIPPRAAIYETVELAKRVVPRGAGLVNAILRRIDRERETIPWPSPEDLPTHLSIVYGHPQWIVQRWIDQLGKEGAHAVATVMSLPPPVTLRVNGTKIRREELLARLDSEGAVGARETLFSPVGVTVDRIPPLGMLPSFEEGLVTVQDESSQMAVLLLDPRPGEVVLDACAAPGGKTTMIAELMGDRGRVVALDRHPRKCSIIAENARRLALRSIEAVAADASLWDPPSPFLFDRILVDAPCSGLGVIRRQPEGKWWRSPEDLPRLARLQEAILSRVARHLKPGGTLVYSTCSTAPEENERVVERFLSAAADFSIDYPEDPLFQRFYASPGIFRSWPHRDGMDGFTAIRFRRQGDSP
ncbi:MAG: 16S rRNA (cytosine(967)-C(5))-methyltransferase RsmB [Desulfuromonadia bacterium]